MFGFKENSNREISTGELKARLDKGDDVFILDVREQGEYDHCNIGGYLVPLRELPKRISELDPSREIVVMCHSGGRSSRAAQFLRESGFANVKNLTGGIDKWAKEVDPKLPRY